METSSKFDVWSAGDAYEHYMGRWSKQLAPSFLAWLEPPRQADWLDIGCGTGVVTEAILRNCSPATVTAIDPSDGFVSHARSRIADPRAEFRTADAMALPVEDASFDVVTSGLVLNFIPDKVAALEEMQRVLKPGGLLSFYVWDYPGGGLGFVDAFWKAAASIDPNAAELDESTRFPVCTPDGVRGLCHAAGLSGAEVTAIEGTSDFAGFEDFWTPFTLGAGPAPGYYNSLEQARQSELKAVLASRFDNQGPFSLPLRAWGARVRTPT